MIITTYISDLLYRYDCVIVPQFGGFVTNEVSATMNQYTHTFYPPTKKISFNRHLTNNDGLLANYIATAEQIPFAQAVDKIKAVVEIWNQQLKEDGIDLPKIGSLFKNEEGQLLFEPNTTENYLTSAFGLSGYSSTTIKREVYKQKSAVLNTELVVSTNSKKRTPILLKYAATAAIVFSLGSFGWNEYNVNQYNNQLAAEQQEQEMVEQKIQQATFVIDKPLPTITLNVDKEIKNYHVIAGAFREPANALKKVAQLHEKGFDAEILGKNKWELTQVAYASFDTRAEAIKALKTIKATDSKDAWLLVKPF
ncbi:SPOR domain-containing protein [Urechidicola sp. KH5]